MKDSCRAKGEQEKMEKLRDYEWVKEIDYKQYLSGDLKQLEEIIGLELFLEIVEAFGKTNIYISDRPVMMMKREYIKKKFGVIPDKELARMLRVSERLIYKIANEKYIDDRQTNLFGS